MPQGRRRGCAASRRVRRSDVVCWKSLRGADTATLACRSVGGVAALAPYYCRCGATRGEGIFRMAHTVAWRCGCGVEAQTRGGWSATGAGRYVTGQVFARWFCRCWSCGFGAGVCCVCARAWPLIPTFFCRRDGTGSGAT